MPSHVKKKTLEKLTYRQAVGIYRFGLDFVFSIRSVRAMESAAEKFRVIAKAFQVEQAVDSKPLGFFAAEFIKSTVVLAKRQNFGDFEEYVIRFIQSETETELN